MRYLSWIHQFFKQLLGKPGLFLVFLAIGACAIAIGALLALSGWLRTFETPIFVATRAFAPGAARAIDGMSVSLASEIDPPLAAVVVDNIAGARPQAGLTYAPFVWEAPAEGGMTRFLAIISLKDNTTSYQPQATSSLLRIGPVRSVRPYMLDLASEFNAPLFHVGGSPEALLRVRAGERTVNEFYRGRFFYRDARHPRPSNVFTDPERMRDALAADQFTAGGVDGGAWTFAEFPKNENASSSVRIHFGAVAVEWRYDSSEGQYVRFEDGTAHTDENGRQIAAANMLVQEATIKILDEVGRRRIDVFGSGNGTVYRAGEAIAAEWKREQKNARTRWYRRDTGEEIIFSPGSTWVEIVSEGMVESVE